MLLQTNSYIVPKEKRAEHVRLLRRFRQALAKLGCDNFEVYEQVGANWSSGEPTGRYVQIMRFRDRRHQLSVQAAERTDPAAQAIIAEFCQLINFPYQQQQGLFAVGFYNAVLQAPAARAHAAADTAAAAAAVAPGVMEAAEAERAAAEPVEGPAGEHEDYVPAPEASAEAEPESPLAEQTLAEVDANEAEEVEPVGRESTEPEAEIETPAGGAEEDAAAPFAEGDAGPEVLDDELGALLDAHLDEGGEESGAAHEDAAGDAPVDKFEALDALDIDDLELPDSPLADPEQRQNHVAR